MGELIHSIELTALTLIKCDFEILDPLEAPNGGSVEFSCEVGFPEVQTKNQFEMAANFQIRGFREENDLFIFKQEFLGVFKDVDIDSFNAVTKELQIQYCMSLIYPTIRDNALYTLSKAGLSQVDIPFHFQAPEVTKIEENT
jgi:preprotein translocase subunit SecB